MISPCALVILPELAEYTLLLERTQCGQVSGVPVVKSDTDYTLVGVLSKKDLSKKGASVKDIMTSPPIAARPDNKVADAACLMLKHKVGSSFTT